MNYSVLYRVSNPLDDALEIDAIKKAGFSCKYLRTDCRNSTVISRYSCLPYFKELENDLANQNCSLINSYKQHKYIADFEYYHDIEKFTAKTYFNLSDVPKEKSYVLKGRTNSRKQKWDTQMFARNWADVVRIYSELCSDSLIGPQGVIIREFLPLRQLGKSDITGVPYLNEFRFWFLGNKLLHHSYYWSIAPEEVINSAQINWKAFTFAQDVADIISKKVNFFVLDIAEKEDKEWVLIEVNDAMCSGLPFDIDIVLYEKLYQELKTFQPV